MRNGSGGPDKKQKFSVLSQEWRVYAQLSPSYCELPEKPYIYP
jgi:hypothetical protein